MTGEWDTFRGQERFSRKRHKSRNPRETNQNIILWHCVERNGEPKLAVNRKKKHQFQVMENVLSEKHNWILYYTTDQKQLVNETADVLQTVWGNKHTSRSDFSLNVGTFKSSGMINGWSWKWCWVLCYLRNVQRYIEVTRRWIRSQQPSGGKVAQRPSSFFENVSGNFSRDLSDLVVFCEFSDFKRIRSQTFCWKPPDDPKS